MGLSDRERTGKILYCVREINEKAEALKDAPVSYGNEKKIKRLITFCDNLWPSLVGSESNSIHWLLGSSSHNMVVDSNEDLWSVAVCSSLPQVREGVVTNDELPDSDGFNPLKSCLDLPSLLYEAEKPDLKYVCKVYELVEGIIYALRRYNDDYLKAKKAFSDLIANIQGTCFSILYKNSDFADCYIVQEICKILYKDHYRFKEEATYKDVVDEWLHSDSMHHYLTRVVGRSGESTEWLIKQHLLLLGSEGVELKRNRVLVAIRMAGRRYHYDHQHKKMFEILGKDKDFKNKIFIAKAKKEIEACKKAKVDDEEFTSKNYKRDNNPSMLYGWDALPEKIEVVVPKKIKKKSSKNLK